MTLRLFAAILITALSAVVGIAWTEQLKYRADQLRLLICVFNDIHTCIYSRFVNTSEICEHIIKQEAYCNSSFVCELKRYKGFGTASEEIWTSAAHAADMNNDDKLILINAAEVIGKYDAEKQLSKLALSLELLNKNLVIAENEYKGKGNMLRKSCILVGAAVGIMLL